MALGLQLFSVAQQLRQDLDGTLAAIAAIGFRHVQPAGLHGYDALRLATAFRRAGLDCHSMHVPLKPHGPGGLSLQDLAAVAEASELLGFRRVVVPMFALPEQIGGPRPDESIEVFIHRATAGIGADYWQPFAALLNRKASELAALGLRLGYHNHNLEFAHVGNTSGYDILLAETDPACVDFELDVGWAQSAGRDPAALLARYLGRFGSLHLKDVAPSTPLNTRFELHPADPGTGLIDWPALFRAADALGIDERIVEREPPFVEAPLRTLENHWRYLSALDTPIRSTN